VKDKKPDLVATITKDSKGNYGLSYAIPRMLQAVLAGIGEGVQVRHDIKKFYKKRSLDQNYTIWGPDYALILNHIRETTGMPFTSEELHNWHKEKFLGYEEAPGHPGLKRLRSTKDLDTVGFAEFRENFCRYWATNGLYIPDPDPEKKKAPRPR